MSVRYLFFIHMFVFVDVLAVQWLRLVVFVGCIVFVLSVGATVQAWVLTARRSFGKAKGVA